MFITKKQHEKDMDSLWSYMKHDYDRLSNRYWSLWHSHFKLMEYLGVEEVERSGREIRKKSQVGLSPSRSNNGDIE